MDQLTQVFYFILAILPILVIFAGLVFFKKSGTFMGVVGWIVCVIIALAFFWGTPSIGSVDVAFRASIYGIISSFSISLMVLFTILQVTMMDVTGAIKSITEFIKTIAAERYEQIMILNVGLGSFLVSIGATPVTMLPPIMLALGFSPLAAIALPCLGYDPLTSFSLLAVPLTAPVQAFVPAADYNRYLGILANNVALFLPVVSTGLAIGMLWVADGFEGVKKGIVPAVVAGLTLGLTCIVFVRFFPDLVTITGVVAGVVAIIALLGLRVVQGKPILHKKPAGAGVATDGGVKNMPLWKAVLPWGLLVIFCIIISWPPVPTILLNAMGSLNKITIVADQVVNLKLLNQAYVWVLVSTILTAPILISSKEQGIKILKIWAKRAWSPTLAAAVFFAIAYIMAWSAKSVVGGKLVFDTGMTDFNMNMIIGSTLAVYLGTALFPAVSPLLGLFGAFVSGSETSSNVMFYGILNKSTGMLNLDFWKVYAGHAVSGGIASGIAPAKIVNASSVIDQKGLDGEVIKKSAIISIILVLIVGAMLFLWMTFIH
jgi:lactate permease